MLHPCTYYSRKLTPAELHYEIFDKELLAIKTAFAKLWHYLEGACYLVQVITDHKNLEYLGKAKALNQQQLRWALIFLMILPSKSSKADVLSRRYGTISQDPSQEPTLILKSYNFLSEAHHKDILRLIHSASEILPDGQTRSRSSHITPMKGSHI